MVKLSLHLLGAPEVCLGDKQIIIEPPTSQALLYYLASHGGTVEPQELIALFWEVGHQDAGKAQLQTALDALRQVLHEPGFFTTTSDRLGLDFNQVYVDQQHFQDLIDQAGRSPWQIPPHQPLPEATVRLLFKAAHLWRTPHFLDGVNLPQTPPFAEWSARAARKLEHLYSRVVGRLAEHSSIVGELDQARHLVNLALVHDKYNENLHALYLRLLMKIGKSAEAIEYFHRLEDSLRRELDTSPSPNLVDLYRQLDKGTASNGRAKPPLEWNLRRNVQIPFVGRGQVIAQMQQASWEGGGILILGESGQGKTRLIQEFTTQVDPQPRVLLANCHQAESNLPFQPLINLFRHQVSPQEWLTLPGDWAGQIFLIFPEIAAMRTDLERLAFEADPKVAPEQTRELLLEAVCQLFLHLSTDQNLIFFLDDAQWSDEATLATIAYLLNHLPHHRKLLLILAARIEQPNSHLEDLAVSLQTSSRFQVVHLPRLNAEEVSHLAQHIIGISPPEDFTRQLAVDSGGNPLFILETLQALSRRELKLIGEGPVNLPLPKSLQSLINTRLNGIPPATRRILEAAAVVGTTFNPEILARVSLYPDAKVVDTLSELEGLKLIEPLMLVEPLVAGPNDLHYRFIHEKIREVLIEEINPLQRRQLHERTAILLEDKAKGHVSEHAAILAQHFELGGSPRQAFHYWIEAGRYALQLYSSTEAVQAFSAARRLIRLTPSLTEEEIHSLYAEWTELAYVMEDASTIQRINDELLQLGKRYGSHLLIGTAMAGQSDACMVANQFERGFDLANQAITHLEQTDYLDEQMQAYNNRGVFLYMLNRIEEAIYSFQDALALGVGSNDLHVIRARANAHFQIAVARTLNGWPKISYSHAMRSLEDYSKVNQPHGQVTAYSALAFARYFLGNYSQARVDCQNGILLAERLQAWRMLGYLHAYRAMIEAASANVDAAFEHATLAIGLGERYGHNEITASGYSVLGDLYSWLDSHDLAIESYQRGIDASNNGFLAVNQMFRLGHSLCRIGSIEAGLKLQQQSVQIAISSGLGLIQLFTQLSEVIVSLMLGQVNRTKTEGIKLLELTSQRAIPSVEIYANIALGRAALVEEDLEAAKNYFLTAASKGAQLPLPWAEIEALQQLEKSWRLSGRPDPAPRERILVLLDQIATTVTREPLLEIFHRYRINASGIE